MKREFEQTPLLAKRCCSIMANDITATVDGTIRGALGCQVAAGMGLSSEPTLVGPKGSERRKASVRNLLELPNCMGPNIS